MLRPLEPSGQRVPRLAALRRRSRPHGGLKARFTNIGQLKLRAPVKVAGVRVPTLAIAGTHDPATTPVDTKFVADQIAGSKFVEWSASHLSNVERREKYSAAVSEFLA